LAGHRCSSTSRSIRSRAIAR